MLGRAEVGMSPEAAGADTPWGRLKVDARHFAMRERRVLDTRMALELFFLTPGFQFVFWRRVQEMLATIPLVGRVLRKISWWMSSTVFRSEIAIEATVGGGLYVPHPYGIVLGACTLGRNVTILQNVTIGRRARSETSDPVIGDEAYLGAGAVVLGGVRIGQRAVIGANAVVLIDVPDGATAVGVPARMIKARTAAEA